MNDQTKIHKLITKRIDSLCKKKSRITNKKVTPYRISKNSGMNPSTLNNLIDGTFKNSRITTIIKICNGLDISIREFFDDELFDKI